MAAPSPGTCMRCGGEREEGFLLDHAHYGSPSQAEWIQGKPEYGFLGGIRKKREVRKVTADRCKQCGFLEFSAL